MGGSRQRQHGPLHGDSTFEFQRNRRSIPRRGDLPSYMLARHLYSQSEGNVVYELWKRLPISTKQHLGLRLELLSFQARLFAQGGGPDNRGRYDSLRCPASSEQFGQDLFGQRP